jgi:hypothetical protein
MPSGHSSLAAAVPAFGVRADPAHRPAPAGASTGTGEALDALGDRGRDQGAHGSLAHGDK